MCLALSLLLDTDNSAHTNGTSTPKTRTHYKYTKFLPLVSCLVKLLFLRSTYADVNQISLKRKLTQ